MTIQLNQGLLFGNKTQRALTGGTNGVFEKNFVAALAVKALHINYLAIEVVMIINPATPNDIPVLCELLTALFTQEAEFLADNVAQTRGLACIIDHPEIGCVLVGRRQGQVLGMVNLLYTVSTALGGRVALLEDMVVAESVRGQGIGSQLLAAAIKYAKHQGCKRITLLTDQNNQSAQRFYAKHGFTLSAMMPLRLDLGYGQF
jgi:GNAT superfamily N-acetyltransferase